MLTTIVLFSCNRSSNKIFQKVKKNEEVTTSKSVTNTFSKDIEKLENYLTFPLTEEQGLN